MVLSSRTTVPSWRSCLLWLVVAWHSGNHNNHSPNYMFATAEKDSNVYPWGDNPNNSFKMYWNNAANVLQDLDQFSSLYIKYHGCVWSECSVDNFDDDGENRDGDEYWFQGRTVDFCANAAYSLYGVLKGSIHLGLHSCSRKSYINSFFTYGGADTMVQAVGETVTTVFDQDGDDDHANAVCYEVEGESGDEHDRELNSNESGDGDNNDGMSSTMGCSADGKFVVAQFSGGYCDGNYYLQSTDDMTTYNSVLDNLGCEQIWNRRKDSTSRRFLEDHNNNNDDAYLSKTGAEYLLSNSWACDVSLYPHGCPDPYGLKKEYDAILSSVANGRNPSLAVANARLQTPLTLLSWMAGLGGLGLAMMTYFVQKREKIKAVGLCPTLWHDFKAGVAWCIKKVRRFCLGVHAIMTGEVRRLRKERKAMSSSKRGSKSRSNRRSKSKDRKKKKKKKKKKGKSRTETREEAVEYYSSESETEDVNQIV